MNDKLILGNQVENFQFIATSNIKGKLSDLAGKYVVLFFYPKDNTPGCTKESKCFRDLNHEFAKFNAVVYGVSKDSLKSHEKFKEDFQLSYELISDKDGKLCDLFDVHRNSLLEKVIGIQRSTFIIDPQGVLVYEWRGVKVTGHVEEVLKKLSELSK